MANLNFLDIAKMNNTDDLTGLIEESISAAPEVQLGAARSIVGTNYETLARTSLPVPGFRSANEGAVPLKSAYANKLVQTFIMDAPIEVDKAVADANEDGAESVIAMEAGGVLEGAFRVLGSQFYYGTATSVATSTALAPTKGYPGLTQTVDAANVFDVGGTGSDTSSAWLIKWGPKDVQWVIGRGGEIQSGDTRTERLTDSAGNPYDGYRKPFLVYVGVQIVNPHSIVRIKNIDSATNTLNDDDIYEALELFPAGIRPDQIFMTGRSRNQIRTSRTATNDSGSPAPMPTEIDGVPIVRTDSLSNAETAA